MVWLVYTNSIVRPKTTCTIVKLLNDIHVNMRSTGLARDWLCCETSLNALWIPVHGLLPSLLSQHKPQICQESGDWNRGQNASKNQSLNTVVTVIHQACHPIICTSSTRNNGVHVQIYTFGTMAWVTVTSTQPVLSLSTIARGLYKKKITNVGTSLSSLVMQAAHTWSSKTN